MSSSHEGKHSLAYGAMHERYLLIPWLFSRSSVTAADTVTSPRTSKTCDDPSPFGCGAAFVSALDFSALCCSSFLSGCAA